jgi:hypothetical protein
MDTVNRSKYIRILNAGQIFDACRMAESGSYVPQVASKYGLTIGQCLQMFYKELVSKDKIMFQKYGKKQYKWKDSKIKETLKGLIDQGYNDDEIAELLETSYFAVSKGRSDCGFVKFNRAIAKGHNSKCEFTHLDRSKLNEQPTQGLFNFTKEDKNFLIEESKGDVRVSQTSDDSVIVPLKKEKNKEPMTVCFQKDDVSTKIKQQIVDKMTWRSVALRMQNPQHLYVLESDQDTYHYKQICIDAYSGLVELELVRKVTANVA